jgi:nucleoside-diphosphate-sugar epimerase
VGPVIVITGAAGNVGGKLRAHLEACGGYDLRLVDIAPGDDPAIQPVDIREPTANWSDALRGADTVVHLAANPNCYADWADLTAPNVDGVLNLYLAAAQYRVKKVVLASSVWASYGRVAGGGPIGADGPDPGSNAYGATKLFAERVAKVFWESHGISTVVVRLGAIRQGDNPPTASDWDEATWISNRDACQGFQRAIDATVEGILIVNLTSDNPGSPWSLATARQSLGYAPQDRGYARPPAPAQPPGSVWRGVKRLMGIE